MGFEDKSRHFQWQTNKFNWMPNIPGFSNKFPNWLLLFDFAHSLLFLNYLPLLMSHSILTLKSTVWLNFTKLKKYQPKRQIVIRTKLCHELYLSLGQSKLVRERYCCHFSYNTFPNALWATRARITLIQNYGIDFHWHGLWNVFTNKLS